MSTGDQSEYLRKKMAERRSNYEQGGQFMKSGFSRWAENERPARQGGAAKEAMERVTTSAGKDILARAKKLGEDMYAQYYKGSARHIKGHNEEESDSEEEKDMEGGLITASVRDSHYEGEGYSGNGRHGGVYDPMAFAKYDPTGITQQLVDYYQPKPVLPEGQMVYTPTTLGRTTARGTKVTGKGKHGGFYDPMGIAREGTKKILGKGATKIDRAMTEKEEEEVRKLEEEMKKGGKRKHGGISLPGKLGEVASGISKAADVIGKTEVLACQKVAGKGKRRGMGKLECVHHEKGEGTRIVGGRRVTEGMREAAEGKVEMEGSGRGTRAAIVKRIMKEKGLSLPAASKYVKEHGLYKA